MNNLNALICRLRNYSACQQYLIAFSKAASLIPTASMKLEFAGHMDFPDCVE